MRIARNSRALRILGMAATAGALTVSVAFAQNESRDREDADIRFRRESNLSGPQQVARAEQYLQAMRNLRVRVQGMLSQARRERDIIKVTCLDDKLTQIDVNTRTARDRLVSLREAVARGDEGTRNHEFTILTVLQQKMNTLSQEADQCAGIEGDVFGRPQLEVEIDPTIPGEDPTVLAEPALISERPVSASGYY